MELADYSNTYRVLQKWAGAMAVQYKANLAEGRNASGALSDSIVARVDVGEAEFDVVLELLSYWRYIEHGTRPHFPPRNAILNWIKVKPVIPRPDSKGRIPSERGLAYLIARKISRVGTSGKADLANAQKTIYQKFSEELNAAFTADAVTMVTNLMRV